MSKIEVLISAMYQNDFSLFDKTCIETDALLINQSDCDKQEEKVKEFGTLKMISTLERGLSCSRNMALKNATGDICLICDDDELLYEGYARKIQKAYEDNPDADVICFQIKRDGKKYPDKKFKVNYLKSLRISSWQLTMQVDSIHRAGIHFDTDFGSGTPLGSGEENIFMFDCLKAGLKIYYVPVCIGEVAQVKSNWFHGFTEQYFLNRGKIIKRLMGNGWGTLYSLYFAVSKYSRYKSNVPFSKAVKLLFEGMRVR